MNKSSMFTNVDWFKRKISNVSCRFGSVRMVFASCFSCSLCSMPSSFEMPYEFGCRFKMESIACEWWDTRQIHSLCYRNSFFCCCSFSPFLFSMGVHCTQNACVAYSRSLIRRIFLCALFMLLHLFTFQIPFDFSILHVYSWSFFTTHSSFSYCVCIWYGVKSASDLEMPSISFNWTHIQMLSTHELKCFLLSTKNSSILIASNDNKLCSFFHIHAYTHIHNRAWCCWEFKCSNRVTYLVFWVETSKHFCCKQSFFFAQDNEEQPQPHFILLNGSCH